MHAHIPGPWYSASRKRKLWLRLRWEPVAWYWHARAIVRFPLVLFDWHIRYRNMPRDAIFGSIDFHDGSVLYPPGHLFRLNWIVARGRAQHHMGMYYTWVPPDEPPDELEGGWINNIHSLRGT